MYRFLLISLIFISPFISIYSKDINESDYIKQFVTKYVNDFLEDAPITCTYQAACMKNIKEKYYTKNYFPYPGGEGPIYVVEKFTIKKIQEFENGLEKHVLLEFQTIGNFWKGKYKREEKIVLENTILEKQNGGWRILFELGGLVLNKKGMLKMLSSSAKDRAVYKTLKNNWELTD